jgi:hypothetical protein
VALKRLGQECPHPHSCQNPLPSPRISPHQFISKWRASTVNERAASQEHFIDLCRLLNEPTPIQADPTGAFYRFEKPAPKTLGGDGAAAVRKRASNRSEDKGKKRDPHQACAQLLDYSDDLENPPLLIVSDIETFKVDTHRVAAEELRIPRILF